MEDGALGPPMGHTVRPTPGIQGRSAVMLLGTSGRNHADPHRYRGCRSGNPGPENSTSSRDASLAACEQAVVLAHRERALSLDDLSHVRPHALHDVVPGHTGPEARLVVVAIALELIDYTLGVGDD
jgi:hypothetical protein